MNKPDPKILLQNHLKIYILLKDKIIFESEMAKRNIEYYCDTENDVFGNQNRYYIKDSDRILIDAIFKENEIIASTETIPSSDYRDEKKTMSLYLKVAGIVVGIMILVIVIESLQK